MFPLVCYLLTAALIQEQNEDAGDAIMSNTLVMLHFGGLLLFYIHANDRNTSCTILQPLKTANENLGTFLQ